jgi:hypothetical protein
MYVVGGASIAVGVLAAGQYLLSLTTGPAWHRRVRRVARIRPATRRGARRRAWNQFGVCLGSVLLGTLLVLSINDATVARLALIAGSALLIWQLGSSLANHARRRSAS